MTQHYDASTFSSGTSIGYLVKLAHALMLDRATEAFAGHDVSFAHWIVLVRLKEGKEVTASDLCRALQHDTGALTRMLDALEERGYLTRERSREDRRVVRLLLTDAGLAKVVELTPIVVERLNVALADFSKTEFDELSRLLNKLIDSIKGVSAAGAA